ncbi:MAG: serine hydrolase domain-containing protein [Gemmatimonadota bacterium]
MRTIAALALALALATSASAQAPDAAARTRVRAALDSIARQAVDGARAAGFVAVAVRGRDTLAAVAYGRADVENDAPLSVHHTFQYASITKQFTAAAVLTLVDAGKVALDAPVTRYLPDAPVRGRAITVRQLLSHTSGLPDFAEAPRSQVLRRLDLPPDSMLALVRDTPMYFAPGEAMRYSNTGFALLGQLIERVSGQPYASYVEQQVLRPAGATRAHFCALTRLVPKLARGYTLGPDGIQPAKYISPSAPWAAGGFCGTAADLTAWNTTLHARRGGGVITPASHAEMVRAGLLQDGRRTRYGLGVALGELAGRRAVAHGGDIDGFTTFTAWLPDDTLSVTVLINTQGPTRPDVVAAALVVAALGAPVTAAVPQPPTLSPFVGHYADDVDVTEVTDAAGRPALRFARGPLPPVVLRVSARNGDAWTFTDGRARYTFEPVAGGGMSMWADMGVSLVRWDRRR